MSTRLLAAMTAAWLLTTPFVSAGDTDEAEKVKLSGYVVDAWCGGGNARPEAKECILACNKKGAKLIFHTAEGKSYKLKDQRDALAHVGTRWQIEATLHGDGLLVVAKWTEAKPVRQAQAGSDG